MKKILFTLVALVASMSISAQVAKLYKNGNLVATFNKDQADEVAFENADEVNGVVDLGLSVKWATCNLGANKPEEAGKYYAWGETTPQSSNRYNWSSYRWCGGTSKSISRYCTDSSYGVVDGRTKLLPEDDAVQVNLPKGWRMPTKAEMEELYNLCKWTYTTMNGTPGYKVVGRNGNSIFLPVTGTRYDSSLNSADWLGSYWTSSLYEKWNDYAYYLTFAENNHSVATMFRCMGMAIRPVYVEHECVDLGLPSGLKWATCNIGAESPEDYGEFYGWGGTIPEEKYSGGGFYDTATALWGNPWRTPTEAEARELFNNCTWEETTLNDKKTIKVTGPNGNYIYMTYGWCWTSSMDYDYSPKALAADDWRLWRVGINNTHHVRPVRP